MADTQLIRIQYVADTAALNQSQTAAQNAQRATDQLRESAKKLGQEGAAGQKQFQGAIAFVKVELEKQKVLVELTNRSDIKLLNERIAKYRQLKAEVDAFNKALNETNKNTKDNTKSFGDLGDIVRATLSVAAIRQVVQLSLEMATLAGNTESVSRAFNRLPASALVLERLREATHGTVTEFELMQKALSASNFGISLQALPRLLEFAAVRAQQTGQSIDYLVNSIVNGIGRKSLLILDNLQISATDIKNELGEVSIKAASVAQVSEAVGRIAERELSKMGGYAETAATKVDQLAVSWQRFKTTVANETSKDGGFVDFLKDLVESARLIVMSRDAIMSEGISQQSVQLAKDFVDSIAGQDTASRIEATQQKMNSLQQTIGQYNDMIRQANEETKLGQIGNAEGAKRYADLVKQYGDQATKIFAQEIGDAKKRLDSLLVNKRVLEETIIVLREYFKTLENAPPPSVESLGLIEAKLQEIEDAGERLKAAKTTTEIHNINNELSRLNAELADLKAFGTTKQFLEVDGKIRLVPVVDPKNFKRTLEQEPIFKEGVTIPVGLSFEIGTRSSANSGAGTAGGSLTEQIDRQIQNAIKNIPTPRIPVEIVPMSTLDRIGAEFEANWQDILGQGLNDTANFINGVIQAEADGYDQRLNELKNFYDQQLILAGDNENQKDRIRLKAQKEELKLRREAFEADKKAKKAQAAINGAVGITNAFATLPYPAAIVASALIAASTLAQIATIEREKPRFAKGKVNISGPGTTTSDSIDAKISKGESVINASATQRSTKLLEGINSGKIDDRILRRLHVSREGVKVVGMSDKRIVDAINRQKYPDYRRIGSDLYEVKRANDGFSERVRRKSLSR